MFEHSIKVPRLYKDAAKILQEVKEKGFSLKQLIYQCKHRNLKAVYALVAETIKHFTSLDHVMKQSQLLEKEDRLDPWLARILITEMLWRGKQLSAQAKPIQTINSYYDILKQHKDAIECSAQTTDLVKKVLVQKPRFARINTLKITLQEAIDAFREEGWTLSRYLSEDYDEYIAKSSSLSSEEFLIDIHIKELLLFSSDTQFYKHRAYKDAYILLQDKASCLAAHLLKPTPGSTVLDMCAAPGMKTTHVAALLNNEGVVYAVEMNQQRFNTLNKIVQNAGATCVKTIHKDAVALTAEECPNVEYILVDPTCSGSGILDRITIDDKQEEISPERLRKLADFQAVILHHALSKFPQVKRIVYSTCSVYPEENEHVVSRVLSKHSNFKLVSARKLLNGLWTNSPSEDVASITDKCLYAKPEKDLTNGFFIAVIEKINSEDQDGDGKIKNKNKQNIKGSYDKNDKKKHKKDKHVTPEMTEQNVTTSSEQNINVSKKKKKKKDIEKPEASNMQDDVKNTEENNEHVASEKKHKKKGSFIAEDAISNNEVSLKESKKKRKHSEDEVMEEKIIANTKQKKKNSKNLENVNKSESTQVEEVKSKQNKKKRKNSEKDNLALDDNEIYSENNSKDMLENNEVENFECKKNKKKKKDVEGFEDNYDGKRKHKKSKIVDKQHEIGINEEENIHIKENKKKQGKDRINLENNEINAKVIDTKKEKKKKKLKKTDTNEDCKEQKSQEVIDDIPKKKHKNKKTKIESI